jgi:hypothetical protein
MNYTDIKSDILDHWDQLAENNYPEDLLTDLASSACPVYYSDVIKDWQEMPNEFTDSWQEFTEATQDSTIFNLMSADLFNYYDSEYQRVFAEIEKEKEEA